MKTQLTLDEYFKACPSEAVGPLTEMRKLLKKLVPEAEETMRYGIPTLRLVNKNLVHFAGYKTHIGFYPASEAIEVFATDLKDYELSKGTIKFSLDKPLPTHLITKIVKWRVEQLKKSR